MLLGALWTSILEPKWSQLGSNWGWERLQHGSKHESVPPIVCTAIGGTPAAASNRQQQTNEDPSWNPDGSNGDLLPFCFHMLNSASRLLAVKGLSWRLLEALGGFQKHAFSTVLYKPPKSTKIINNHKNLSRQANGKRC